MFRVEGVVSPECRGGLLEPKTRVQFTIPRFNPVREHILIEENKDY